MASLQSLVNRKNWNKVKRLMKQGQWQTVIRAAYRKLNEPDKPERRAASFKSMTEMAKRREGETYSRFPDNVTVDVVIPIYNGYDYLTRLLKGVERTEVHYRLILVDDCSSDERMAPFLDEYARTHENVRIIHNERNLGFVASANRGLVMTKHNVALVNTDVELPDGWLERLMMPLEKDSTVASATPFTNSGTIASFPAFLENNTLFNDLPVDQIDGYFKKVRCLYTTIPTGVGFCMAMSQKAIKTIGIFDQQAFGRGYGEENDWCQRAVEAGMRNVMVENLYVHHHHGGTFLPAEKRRLQEENREILLQKHPKYAEMVAAYNQEDPLSPVRAQVFMELAASLSKSRVLMFHNELGGGANTYLEKERISLLEKNCMTEVVRYIRNKKTYQVDVSYRGYSQLVEMDTLEEVFELASENNSDEVFVNQLVTYPDPGVVMDGIRHYCSQSGSRLTVMAHDYYMVCPTIYLLSSRHTYCGLPEMAQCEECFARNAFRDNFDVDSMKKWREMWKEFLSSAQEIRVFSRDSERILRTVYGDLDVRVMPVQHTCLEKVTRRMKRTDGITIGILGTLTELKGASLIASMVHEAETHKMNVKFVLIGSSQNKIGSSYFEETGAYRQEQLPSLVLEKDIDMIFISSIIPETFSYTTQEAMEMGLPVACLPLGAPQERIQDYEKGVILSSMDPKVCLRELIDAARRFVPAFSPYTRNVLMICEEESYATRFRLEHLKEQLNGCGMTSRIRTVDEVSKNDLKDCGHLILYRTAYSHKLHRLVQEASRRGMAVHYSLDDLIFDYSKIKDQPFLSQDEYSDFEERCEKAHQMMEQCDDFIVSTQSLKEEVEKAFTGKKAVIQRNRVSYEMQAISKRVMEEKDHVCDGCQKEDKVVLGYFSGSSTHNEDLAYITPCLVKLMTSNRKVELLLVGALEEPEELKAFGERVRMEPFVPYFRLQELYAQISINLMPLRDSLFASCKSENKWLEAALLKVPTVASRNAELERVIHNWQDGVLCKDLVEWSYSLERLTVETQIRRKIGQAAYDAVRESHTTRQLEEEVLDILD